MTLFEKRTTYFKMKENLRKCIKCGSSPSEDARITLHRFPKPGRTNSLRCALWNKYCFPNESWSSPEFQGKLYSQHKMLCNKHFTKTCFIGRKLFRTAVPCEEFNEVCGADVTNSPDTSCPALSADTAKPADITNAADITESADITDGVVITDIADGHVNDGDTQEETEEQLFSWQRDIEINCDDFDINPDNAIAVQDSAVIQTEYGDTIGESSLKETRSETEYQSKDVEKDLHEGYKCDMCNGPIYRFRYSCVECANYDLCGACEARAAHPQHYLLRVPRPRPHGEIQLIMDTIRRFLTADLKSLRAEANFVNTLMDEMKSEVLSEAGSDPVPDEPDYPIQLNDSTEEHEDCEMESNATHPSAMKDDVTQDIIWLDEDILEEYEIPLENSDCTETIHNNDLNDRGTHLNAKLKTEYAHTQHKPEKRKMYDIGSLSSSSTSGKVTKKIFLTCPKKVLITENVKKPELRIIKIESPSHSNASDKECKNILVNYPKKVTISNNVHSNASDKECKNILGNYPKKVTISKAINEAVKMQTSIKTINTGVQCEECNQVKRLSKELKPEPKIHDSNT